MTRICTPLVFAASFMAAVILNSPALAADPNKGDVNYDEYATSLKKYVDDAGMVNYEQLKADPQQLQAFVTTIARLDRRCCDKWSEKDQIAFWLNAYNGLTLKVIIDNYPIKSSFFRSRVYPKNSIRQITGVWDKITFDVMGQKLTLGHIEHEILRKKFDEPRIHMAMVCAAMSCPPLRNAPYIGQKLDEQLADQSRKFLADPDKFRISREKTTVHLSPIFKWFNSDFVTKHAPRQNIGKHNRKTSAVLNFIANHLPESDRDFILKGAFKIKYLKYDWSLNEQQKTEGEKKRK
ncbi:MAG: DUF547 domain-containing protein [Planctomycetota bacterium]|jgi:hypothetical protein